MLTITSAEVNSLRKLLEELRATSTQLSNNLANVNQMLEGKIIQKTQSATEL
jgi:hypothetical protein